MNYKNHILTFEKTLDFDGMTDSTISGSKELFSGKCVDYHRSGWHKTWYILNEKGERIWCVNTFHTLKAIDGKPIK